MKKIAPRVFLCTILIALSASCNQKTPESSNNSKSLEGPKSEQPSSKKATKPEDDLIGKWQEVNGPDSIEFRKDGMFTARLASSYSKAPKNLNGAYFVEGDLISIKPSQGYSMTWKYRLSEGELIITYQQGGDLKLNGDLTKYKKV